MKPGLVFACAMTVPLLTFAGQAIHAQDVWPPDDETPPRPQQTYSQAGTQSSYGQQAPQPAYGSPGYGQSNGNGQAASQPSYGYGQGGPNPASAQAGAGQPMNAEQLDQLVAPIALYPDTLVAQILTASTYPAEISAADQWMRGMGNASPEQVAAGASEQTGWDPSVKALTAFPQVLQMLSSNLQWTASLGNTYYNQPQDVLQTVQVLRGRAEQAGNLQSTPQEQVVDNPGYISVAPRNPEVVYVPSYNPSMVYGEPVAPYPGFYAGVEAADYVGSAVEFGVGFAVGAFLRVPFGLMAWGFDWLGGGILFDHECYWPRGYDMDDWGFEHGGPRYGGWYEHGGWRGESGGQQMVRFGDYHNQGIPVHPGQGGFNRNGNFPVARAGGGAGVLRGGQNENMRAGGFPTARAGGGTQNGPAGSGLNRENGFPVARPGGGLGGQNGFGQNGANRNGYNGAPGQGYNRLGNQAGGNQSGMNGGGYPRGNPVPYSGGYGGGNSGQRQPYGNMPGAAGRPQPYGGGGAQGYAQRPGSNAGTYSRYGGGTPQSGQGFVGRQGGGYGFPRYGAPSQGYRGPAQTYRAPTQNYGRSDMSRGSTGAYAGRYGGFGHGSSGGYSGSFGGGHAPSYGGGHSGGFQSNGGGPAQSFGGGHSGGFGGGGHSSGGFGGGSHGGGGNYSSGGGHSSGGHSAGGSSHGRH